MRSRIVALATAIALFVFLGARSRRPSAKIIPRSEVERLLPSRVGSFRVVSRTDYPAGYEWLAYRDGQGDAVDVVVDYGATAAHDSVGCFWARAQDPLQHHLATLKTANPGTSAVFDVAMFTGVRARARLVASTECRATGCKASLYSPVGWIWSSPDTFFVRKPKPPIPVAISITSPLPTNDGAALMRALKGFVGGLNLSAVRKLAATK